MKKIKLQNQIGLFAIILSVFLLFSFIVPLYCIFEDIIFQQVSENSRMMLEQMNLLNSHVLTRLENLALSISMNDQVQEGLIELKQTEGYDQIGAINKITNQLIYYQGTWDNISEITIYTEAMDLEPYLTEWGYNYVKDKKSLMYQSIAEQVSSRKNGIIQISEKENEEQKQFIIFFQKMNVFSGDENVDLLCVKISEHIFETVFEQRYSGESSYFMLNKKSERVVENGEVDLLTQLQNEDSRCLENLSNENTSVIKQLDDQCYIISSSGYNRFDLRMLEFKPYVGLINRINNLMVRLVLIGLSVITLMIPLIVWFSHRFVKPICHLSRQMKKVGTGDFNVTVEDGYTNEIGQINQQFLAMVSEIQNLIRSVERVSQQKNLTELEMLQQQINPHFLYNVLDNINWMAIREKKENISQVIVQLGDYFRLNLANGKPVITLREELNCLKNYVELQRKCTNKQFDYVEEIEEELYSVKIIRLLLQPFVENAIIHGCSAEQGDCEITVSGWSDEKDFYIQISDEGIGVSIEKMEDYLSQGRSGYGVYNVNQRIKLCYGEEYGIKYLPVQKGTTVLIHLSQEMRNENVSNDDRRR